MVAITLGDLCQEVHQVIADTLYGSNNEHALIKREFNLGVVSNPDFVSKRPGNSQGKAVSPFLHPSLHYIPPDGLYKEDTNWLIDLSSIERNFRPSNK